MDNTTRRRRTKSGEAAPPPASPHDNKRKRYNLRKRNTDEVRWVDDDTLQLSTESDDDDSTYAPSESESDIVKPKKRSRKNDIAIPAGGPVSVNIIIHGTDTIDEEDEDEYEDSDEEDEYEDSEDDDDDEDEDSDEEEEALTSDDKAIAMLLARSLGASYGRGKPMLVIDDEPERPKKNQFPIYLSKKEEVKQ